MIEQLVNIIAEYQQRPTIVDRVSKNLIFYGFPLPTTKGENYAEWLIQIYVKGADNVERTGFANGVREYNQRWTDRYNLTYKMGKEMNAIEFEIPI